MNLEYRSCNKIQCFFQNWADIDYDIIIDGYLKYDEYIQAYSHVRNKIHLKEQGLISI